MTDSVKISVKCPFCFAENPSPGIYGGHIYKCSCGGIFCVDDRVDLHEAHADMRSYLIGRGVYPDDPDFNLVEFHEIGEYDFLHEEGCEEFPEEQVLLFARLRTAP